MPSLSKLKNFWILNLSKTFSTMDKKEVLPFIACMAPLLVENARNLGVQPCAAQTSCICMTTLENWGQSWSRRNTNKIAKNAKFRPSRHLMKKLQWEQWTLNIVIDRIKKIFYGIYPEVVKDDDYDVMNHSFHTKMYMIRVLVNITCVDQAFSRSFMKYRNTLLLDSEHQRPLFRIFPLFVSLSIILAISSV